MGISKTITNFCEDGPLDMLGGSMLFVIGLMAILSLWGMPEHLGLAYWSTIIIILLSISIILVEWIYVDACNDDGLGIISTDKVPTIGDYLTIKGLSIIIVFLGVPIILAGIGCILGILYGLGYCIYKLGLWLSINTHTLQIALLIIVAIIIYLGVNVLIGKALYKKPEVKKKK